MQEIFEKSTNKMAGIYIIYNASCLFETVENFGISHLIEHMVCESLKSVEIQYDIERIESNAFTGKEYVVFYLTGLLESVNKYKDDFKNRIINYFPKKEDFEKEIAIVKQEYNNYYSDSNFNAYCNYMSIKRGFIGPIGTRYALDKITFEDVCDFYTNNFWPIKIIEVSDFDYKSEEEIFRSCEMNKGYFSPQIAKVDNNSLPMIYGFKESNIEEDHYLNNFVINMLSYGLRSPLYKIREENHLVYYVSMYENTYGNKFTNLITTQSKKENKVKIFDIINSIVNDENNMSKERFDIIYQNTKNKLLIRQQMNYEWSNVQYYTQTNNIKDNFNLITYEKVIEFYRKNFKNQIDSFLAYDDLVM